MNSSQLIESYGLSFIKEYSSVTNRIPDRPFATNTCLATLLSAFDNSDDITEFVLPVIQRAIYNQPPIDDDSHQLNADTVSCYFHDGLFHLLYAWSTAPNLSLPPEDRRDIFVLWHKLLLS